MSRWGGVGSWTISLHRRQESSEHGDAGCEESKAYNRKKKRKDYKKCNLDDTSFILPVSEIISTSPCSLTNVHSFGRSLLTTQLKLSLYSSFNRWPVCLRAKRQHSLHTYVHMVSLECLIGTLLDFGRKQESSCKLQTQTESNYYCCHRAGVSKSFSPREHISNTVSL